jgi:hypothetical protein
MLSLMDLRRITRPLLSTEILVAMRPFYSGSIYGGSGYERMKEAQTKVYATAAGT